MSQSSGADDWELVQRAKAGDRSAFDCLMLMYQREIIGLAWRLLGNGEEAVDVAQEAFFRAYRGLSDFRQEASFRTWLYGITMNLVRHRRRWHVRHKTGQTISIDAPEREGDEESPSVGEGLAAVATSPREVAQQKDLRRKIESALEKLPAPLKQVVLLRDMNGLSYEEVAQVCGEAVGTVKSRLHRGRQMLRELLGGIEREL